MDSPSKRIELVRSDSEAAGEHEGGGRETASYSFRILQSAARYVKESFGADELERIAREAGISADQLDGGDYWGTVEQLNEFNKKLRALVDSDEEYRRAHTYKLKESYGPLRFFLRAQAPARVYEMAARHFGAISTVSSGEVDLDSGRNRIVLRYRSTEPESRLMCISRQAQSAALPTLWGLPPAHLEERCCICNGDDRCEYVLKIYEARRWLPQLAGAALGALGALAAVAAGAQAVPVGVLWAALPSIGLLVGHLYELRRTNKVNFEMGEEIGDELRRLLREHVGARREIYELHQRQREWSLELEKQVAERTGAMREVLSRLRNLKVERQSTLRGFSHDLRNPLQTLTATNQLLTEEAAGAGEETRALLEEQRIGIESLTVMLDDLVQFASAEGGLRLKPKTIEIPPLVDSLRRRLRALVQGRDIRVSVMSNREAPDRIEMDQMVLDRVVDNLLTNAAKYTSRGSIVVELDGKPGFLTLKVSDTGRGIDKNQIEQVFHPGGSPPELRASRSLGVGLSVVVRLLAQIGGRLEVMSLPDKGTTFWAHFPVEVEAAVVQTGAEQPRGEAAADDPVAEVVTIRRAEGE
ncbi:MAG: HAMP domain-containing sensor histidine kinase [Polyangia bacterium]